MSDQPKWMTDDSMGTPACFRCEGGGYANHGGCWGRCGWCRGQLVPIVLGLAYRSLFVAEESGGLRISRLNRESLRGEVAASMAADGMERITEGLFGTDDVFTSQDAVSWINYVFARFRGATPTSEPEFRWLLCDEDGELHLDSVPICTGEGGAV